MQQKYYTFMISITVLLQTSVQYTQYLIISFFQKSEAARASGGDLCRKNFLELEYTSRQFFVHVRVKRLFIYTRILL